jgi:carbamoyltransferase
MDYVFEQNLHKGLRNIVLGSHEYHIAASAQYKLEVEIFKIMNKAKKYSDYLCYGGGVALNCVANSKIRLMFKDMWIMPNPGDCGSSLGAAALAYGNKLNWRDAYLGTNICREVNPKKVVKHLLKHFYCGIANGRAEFGPRALGNRSLISDPRRDIKRTVNQIKRRQNFRPFAPAILEEYADEYFEGPMNEYMQYVARAKHDYESVTHVDGTARVQIVPKDSRSIIRPILEEWYEKTKCPMLLNTSLNIKGQPMVDTWEDALEFEKKYNVKVF